MKTLAHMPAPTLYDPIVDRNQTEIPDYYLPSATNVLIAGPAILPIVGCSRGAPMSGWTRGVTGYYKLDSTGCRTLWVQRCGSFSLIERTAINPLDHDEALVCSFSGYPIWAPTMRAAMQLAEHCDPLPRSLLAACWLSITSK
jgi:hypothetical protein